MEVYNSISSYPFVQMIDTSDFSLMEYVYSMLDKLKVDGKKRGIAVWTRIACQYIIKTTHTNYTKDVANSHSANTINNNDEKSQQ